MKVDFIHLNRDERMKFADWLKQEAESYKLIDAELKKLPGMLPLVKMHEMESEACQIIEMKLRAIEEL